MNLQPTLADELVEIRPLLAKDREALYFVAKDPNIWEQHPVDRYKRELFDMFFDESLKSGGCLVILDKKTQQIIGSSRYKLLADFPHGIEIGWSFLARTYWGGLYNGAIKRLLMDYALLHFEHVVYFIDSKNIRSQKAVEKIGGKKASTASLGALPSTSSENMIYVASRS
ncbi:GNAT family N-acetyltransferase [Gilvibacter sediminis]|uniref:GNAT family N-acetyltransferase n=1 Tax=Gilvibacter sediminis TaxID=379071 RepID=UPI002350DD81|nr:GNAT family N-acetyltransferase [Gilvibacter sediminis]MDC7998939.1 GNAT family N-acetyltransferase [Gilvibacter sediminis]